MVQIDHKGGCTPKRHQRVQTRTEPPDQIVTPQHKVTTQIYIPNSGVANWLILVGSSNRHPTHHHNTHRRWSKGKVEGRSTICKLEAKRQRTNEFPGPTCEQLCMYKYKPLSFLAGRVKLNPNSDLRPSLCPQHHPLTWRFFLSPRELMNPIYPAGFALGSKNGVDLGRPTTTSNVGKL